MDLVSPLFPSAFVFVVCLGSLSRSFSKFLLPLLKIENISNLFNVIVEICCPSMEYL